ncbi:MAG: hypothetical protein M1839_008745 [Geoglossum umbratile]|nr:MAG: hypothetical protein M1839_008745 [Geoglossum umbratile]
MSSSLAARGAAAIDLRVPNDNVTKATTATLKREQRASGNTQKALETLLAASEKLRTQSQAVSSSLQDAARVNDILDRRSPRQQYR